MLGVFWKEFHGLLRGHSGIYVLYKHDVQHYVGKASNLSWRIRHYQNDRLKGKWDSFSLYVVCGDRYVKDVESLLLSCPQLVTRGCHGTGRSITLLPRSQADSAECQNPSRLSGLRVVEM